MRTHLSAPGLAPGDRIVVPKSKLGLVQHHAVYLGQDKNGRHLFAENKIGIGVRVVDADDFFKDVTEVTRIEKFKGSKAERKQVVQRALQRMGLPYNLINYNCEHFANDVLTNKIVSDQVSNFFVLGFLVLGSAIFIRLND